MSQKSIDSQNLKSIDPVISEEDINNFERLKENSRNSIHNINDSVDITYKKNDALNIIHSGYVSLPTVYRDTFLDPVLNLIETENFDQILELYGGYGNPLFDWLMSIDQRHKEGKEPLSPTTKAFQEFCQDIFDGYLSLSSRKGAKLPEHQIIAPLVKWGGDTPYTWPATMGANFNMKMSIISLPTTYSENIALWPLCAHECYHDIINADEGLLNELEDVVYDELMKLENAGELDKLPQNMQWNGSKDFSLAKFAAKYWRTTMEETAADVCALLNIGPTAGISFAVLALSLNNNTLETSSYIEDPHPNEALRISLAAEVTKQFEDLDLKIRDAYIKFFDQIMSKYMKNNNKDDTNFVLYSTMLDNETKNEDVRIPFKSMEKTVEVVAKVIGFTKLKSLENHSLAEINTWTNRDQILTQRIAIDLLNAEDDLKKAEDVLKKAEDVLKKAEDDLKKAEDVLKKAEDDLKAKVDLKKAEDVLKKAKDDLKEAEDNLLNSYFRPGPDGQEVYAAHIVAAATLASIKKPDIAIKQQNSESITKRAIKMLQRMYGLSPVWRGYSVIYRSDAGKYSIKSYKHNITSYKKSNDTHIKKNN